MDLYDIAIARKLSGSGGGGGSSDFSTAEVTIYAPYELAPIVIPALYDEEGYSWLGSFIYLGGIEGETYTVPLFKGQCSFVTIDGNSFEFAKYSATGGVHIVDDLDGAIYIDGDGTLTYNSSL